MDIIHGQTASAGNPKHLKLNTWQLAIVLPYLITALVSYRDVTRASTKVGLRMRGLGHLVCRVTAY